MVVTLIVWIMVWHVWFAMCDRPINDKDNNHKNKNNTKPTIITTTTNNKQATKSAHKNRNHHFSQGKFIFSVSPPSRTRPENLHWENATNMWHVNLTTQKHISICFKTVYWVPKNVYDCRYVINSFPEFFPHIDQYHLVFQYRALVHWHSSTLTWLNDGKIFSMDIQ